MLGNQRGTVDLNHPAEQGRLHARAFSKHDADVRPLHVHDRRHGVLPFIRPLHVQVSAAATHGARVADVLRLRRADESVAAVKHRRHLPDHQVDDHSSYHLHSDRVLRADLLTSCQADTGSIIDVI